MYLTLTRLQNLTEDAEESEETGVSSAEDSDDRDDVGEGDPRKNDGNQEGEKSTSCLCFSFGDESTSSIVSTALGDSVRCSLGIAMILIVGVIAKEDD